MSNNKTREESLEFLARQAQELDMGYNHSTMEDIRVNTNQVTSIETIRKAKVDTIEYFKERRRWGFVRRREGFYQNKGMGWVFVSDEDINASKRMFREGEVVYFYPHVEMYTADKRLHIRFFETMDELDMFLVRFFPHVAGGSMSWQLVDMSG